MRSRLHRSVTGHSQRPYSRYGVRGQYKVFWMNRKFPTTLIYIFILLLYYLMSNEMLITCWSNYGDMTMGDACA
jgi:hypothetical protein